MGYVNFSIPKKIVLRFKENGGIKNFIETGTYKGGTCFWAAHHFKKVYTIEIDPAISKATSLNPECPANIKFYVGDSKDVLPDLVTDIEGTCLFWLDGHWCDVTELGKDKECPLLDEIKALKNFGDSVILIDDARAFLGPLPPPHDNSQWPGIDEIFLLLKAQFPANLVTIVDDVIYCIPPNLISVFKESWIEDYAERFGPKKNNFFIRKIKAIVRIVGLKK
ncbi:MAG: hypothetical protein ABIR03_10460 [Ginsengibacter sp.]